MRVLVISKPEPVVNWEDADAHLKLGGDVSLQAEVEAMIAAATEMVDGPDGWLGRALGVQTLEARFDCFEYELRLPCPPLIDLDSVKYINSAGDLVTLDAARYELIDRSVLPIGCWPASQPDRREAVRARYRAGHVTDPEADELVPDLPYRARAAILMMVEDLYTHRGSIRPGVFTELQMSTTVKNLLSGLRVYS